MKEECVRSGAERSGAEFLNNLAMGFEAMAFYLRESAASALSAFPFIREA